MSDTTHISITEVERNLGYVAAREPEAAIAFTGDPEDIWNPDVRLFIMTARDLVARDKIATIDNIAAASGLDVTRLKSWADACDRTMRRDWTTYAELISLDAVRRRLQDFGAELHRKTSTVTNLFDVEQLLKGAQSEMMLIDRAEHEELFDVGDILDVYAKKPEMRIAPLETQYYDINRLTKGGLGRKRMWVLSGPQKRGKTTFFRNLFLYWARKGHRVCHVAQDGGDKYDHALSYWAMLAHQFCIETRSPVEAVVKETGERIFLLTDEYMNAYTTETIDFGALHVDKRTIACIDKARAELKKITSKSATGGALMLMDASDVHGDLYELIRMLERLLVTRGLAAFGIDHIGQFDNKMRSQQERMDENVRQMTRFKNNRGVPCVIIAQQTRDAVDNGEENYSAGLRFLATLEHECDWLTIIKGDHSMPERTKGHVQFSRIGPGGVDFFLRRYEESGLITQIEG